MKDNIINKYNGFFLIELLVALGILSLLFLFIYHFQVSIYEQKYEGEKYNEALFILNSVIEETAVCGLKIDKIEIKGFKITFKDIFNPLTNNSNKEKANKNNFILKNIEISWTTLKGKERRISLISGFIL